MPPRHQSIHKTQKRLVPWPRKSHLDVLITFARFDWYECQHVVLLLLVRRSVEMTLVEIVESETTTVEEPTKQRMLVIYKV